MCVHGSDCDGNENFVLFPRLSLRTFPPKRNGQGPPLSFVSPGNFRGRKRERERKRRGISVALLVNAGRSGGARQGKWGSERTGCERQHRDRRTSGRGKGDAEGRVVMGVAIERSKHCKSISRRLPALRTRLVFHSMPIHRNVHPPSLV